MTLLLERNTTADAGVAPHEFHWTATAFYQAESLGVFKEPNQLELIYGRIIEKMPQSPLHRACRVRISRRLRSALTSPLDVVDECPIHIAFDGEPVPDIVVLQGMEADDQERHPTPEDVRLLVEVAVSSEVGDLGGKSLLYAQADIADYWVVLPEKGQIVVHRAPSQGGYASVTTLGVGETISPLAASDAILAVADLLGNVQDQ